MTASLLTLGEEPGEHLHPDRVGSEALGEGLVVLLGQEGGRAQYRHLLAIEHRLEGGPDRHLGLAVADIAEDQPVHGPVLSSMSSLTSDDGGQLVGRLLVREGGLHLALPGRVLAGRRARRRPPVARCSATTCSATAATARRTRARVSAQSLPPMREIRGSSPPVYLRTAASWSVGT